MAFTEIYVDPSIAADSGAGTSGDPYGDLEYAIEQETFDTTNGTRVNIKAGTDEILAASLQTAFADTSVSVAWVPTEAAPCIIQGYTTTAGDGGIGGISGGGSVGVFGGAALDYIKLIDLHMHNCGSANVIDLDNFIHIFRCEVDNTTGKGITVDASVTVSECYVHNVGSVGIEVVGGGLVSHNYVEGGSETNKFTLGISCSAANITVYRNIVNAGATSASGIRMFDSCHCINNSIYNSTAGTANGVQANTGNAVTSTIINNLVEGWSGTGGQGFDLDPGGTSVIQFRGNATYDCETSESSFGNWVVDYEVAEVLSASPFTSASTADFSPVDTGNVKEGSYPADFGNGAV